MTINLASLIFPVSPPKKPEGKSFTDSAGDLFGNLFSSQVLKGAAEAALAAYHARQKNDLNKKNGKKDSKLEKIQEQLNSGAGKKIVDQVFDQVGGNLETLKAKKGDFIYGLAIVETKEKLDNAIIMLDSTSHHFRMSGALKEIKGEGLYFAYVKSDFPIKGSVPNQINIKLKWGVIRGGKAAYDAEVKKLEKAAPAQNSAPYIQNSAPYIKEGFQKYLDGEILKNELPDTYTVTFQ